ncbi:OmpA family protein [Streptomyces coacervatus]|uniref:OmpA family protein n=1 Tax=Streptomyces coacervatus TaxID=647381 RepID=UPI0023D97CF5|nr:OmpA family protein [Streptomyces coacervatus]MDF2272146.1 OmpA family protein [Streptomyces coacervatus]
MHRVLGRIVGPVLTAVAVASTAVAATGCSSPHHKPADVTVAVTATSAEPAPALPESVMKELHQAAAASKRPGDAVVRLLVGGGARPQLAFAADLTPRRSNGAVEHSPRQREGKIQKGLEAFDSRLRTARSGAPGLDLLNLLDRAARVQSHTRIIVISSGLSTADPVDYRQLGLSGDPQKVAADLKARHLLPDLSGHQISFAGLGETAGGQSALPPAARQTLQETWRRICTLADASSCQVIDELAAAMPPTATKPVPRINVPLTVTRPGPRPGSQKASLPDTVLGFRADSAALSPAADAALRPLVQLINTRHLRADITGHVADVGPGHDGMQLSLRRARAVADRLVALGAPRGALRSVTGRGDLDPVIHNWTNGSFNEALASRNRRTEVLLDTTTTTR